MAEERFDDWARGFGALSVGASRRRGLRLLLGGTLMSVLGMLPHPGAEAKKKHKKHKKNRKDGPASCEVSLETPCIGRDDCCGQTCCRFAGEFEGTCCTSDAPLCFVLTGGTQRVCMENTAF